VNAPVKAVLAGFFLAAAAGVANAATAPSEFQPRLEELKEQALEIDVQALENSERLATPRAGAVTLYLGASTSDFVLVSAHIAIDDGPGLARDFSPLESDAFSEDALLPWARSGVIAGVHSVRAEVVVRARDAPSEQAPLNLSFQGTFDQANEPVRLGLILGRENRWSTPRLRLVSWHAIPEEGSGLKLRGAWHSLIGKSEAGAMAYVAGGAEDPEMRVARFLAQTGDMLAAAAWISRQADRYPEQALPANYYEAFSRTLIDYGLLGIACREIVQALDAGLEAPRLAELRLNLAAAYVRRGDYDAAQQQLDGEPAPRDKVQRAERQALEADILLQQGRVAEAATQLKVMVNNADFAGYIRYFNLGVSLIADGRPDEGVTVLDRVGKIQCLDSDLCNLRDRANLALGAYFLHIAQGASAIPILERVGIEGRFSNRALLDLGWAWLAPPGTTQRTVPLGDERMRGAPPETFGGWIGTYGDSNLYQRYQLHPFAEAKIHGDEGARLKRALGAWAELIRRDPADGAVQEGLPAVGLALQRLGAFEEATGFFNRAVDALTANQTALQQTHDYVISDHWVTDLLVDPEGIHGRVDPRMSRLPPAMVAPYLSDLLASAEFYDGLNAYRELQALDRRLAEIAASIPSSDSDTSKVAMLRSQLASSQADVIGMLRERLLRGVSLQTQWTDKLLANCRLTLARIYEKGTSP